MIPADASVWVDHPRQADAVLHMVQEQRLFGRGLGCVDVHLLAAALLTPDLRLWTRDCRLHEAAFKLGRACSPGVQ